MVVEMWKSAGSIFIVIYYLFGSSLWKQVEIGWMTEGGGGGCHFGNVGSRCGGGGIGVLDGTGI